MINCIQKQGTHEEPTLLHSIDNCTQAWVPLHWPNASRRCGPCKRMLAGECSQEKNSAFAKLYRVQTPSKTLSPNQYRWPVLVRIRIELLLFRHGSQRVVITHFPTFLTAPSAPHYPGDTHANLTVTFHSVAASAAGIACRAMISIAIHYLFIFT